MAIDPCGPALLWTVRIAGALVHQIALLLVRVIAYQEENFFTFLVNLDKFVFVFVSLGEIEGILVLFIPI